MQLEFNPQTGERRALVAGTWVTLPNPNGTPTAAPATSPLPAPGGQSTLGVLGRAAYQAAVPATLQEGAGLARMVQGQTSEVADWLSGAADKAQGLVAEPEGPATLGEAWQKGDLLRYGARQVGQGIGSTAPILGTATAAAGLGLSGPAAAAVALGSAAGVSYMQNAGSMYNDLRQQDVDPDTAAKTAGLAGIPIALLDVVGASKIPGVGRFLAEQVSDTALKAVGKGTAWEFGTEGTQQLIQELASAKVAPHYDVRQGASNVVENAIAGGLTGGVLGTVGAPFRGHPAIPEQDVPPPPEQPTDAPTPPPARPMAALPPPSLVTPPPPRNAAGLDVPGATAPGFGPWQPVYPGGSFAGYQNLETGEFRSPAEHLAPIPTPLSGLPAVIDLPTAGLPMPTSQFGRTSQVAEQARPMLALPPPGKLGQETRTAAPSAFSPSAFPGFVPPTRTAPPPQRQIEGPRRTFDYQTALQQPPVPMGPVAPATVQKKTADSPVRQLEAPRQTPVMPQLSTPEFAVRRKVQTPPKEEAQPASPELTPQLEAAQAPAAGPPEPEPVAQPETAAEVPVKAAVEAPVAADFYKDNPRPEELGKFLPSNWTIAKSKKQVETALRKGQNQISRKEYNAARDKAMAAREAKPEPVVEAQKQAEPAREEKAAGPVVIRAEDFGYKEPTKLGPPGPPRTVKITYASNLDTLDRARSQPGLTPAQRKAAEEANARTVKQFKEAEKQAREILKSSPGIPEHALALKEWGEKLGKAADGGLSLFARKAERDQWRRGFEEGARNTEHQPRAHRTRDDGYKAGEAWLASNPKPPSNATITVEARTARGQKTTFELPADPEAIARVRERFEKLPPQAKYRRPGEPARWFTRAVMPDGSVRDRSFEAKSSAEARGLARREAQKEAGANPKRIVAQTLGFLPNMVGRHEITGARDVPGEVGELGQKAKQLQKELRDLVRRIAGSRVRLSAVGELLDTQGRPVEAHYIRGVIRVALSDYAGGVKSTEELQHSARHEAVHFLREVGALDAEAWRTLEKRATKWRQDFDIDQRYSELGEAERTEEAIAEAYAAWAKGKLPMPPAVFGRIKQILAAIRDAVRKLFGQHATAEDVFAALEAGAFAEKGGAPGGVRSKDMLPAWHGSPHDFEEFDYGKIGTGEGNQAYGHGLYFSSRKEIAEHYQHGLSDLSSATVDGEPLDTSNPEHVAAAAVSEAKTRAGAADLMQQGLRELREGKDPGLDKAVMRRALDLLQSDKPLPKYKIGHLYQVELAPDDDQLLDWDKPFSEQPAGVRAKLTKLGVTTEYATDPMYGGPPTREAWGHEMYNDLSRRTRGLKAQGDAAASAALRDAGIPGIRYLDAGSRSAGEGHHNYVIFSDDDVKITAKYRRPMPTRPDFIAEPEPGPLQQLFRATTTAADRSWWRNTALPKLAQLYVNKLDPVGRAEIRRYGVIQDASVSTFKLAEMAGQDSGRFELLASYGFPRWNQADGIVEIDDSVGGLVPTKKDPTGGVFNELKRDKGEDYNKFQGYAYAKRAQRLLAEGRERLMSAEKIRDSLNVSADQKARFDRMLGRYQRFNEGLLQFLVDTGTIAQGSRDAYASTMDYVPFYRVLEETGELLGPNDARRGLSNPDPRIKKLLGGTEKLGDLFDNIARNGRALTTAGLRNVAMQRSHDLFADLGEIDEGQGDGAVSYFVNGQKKFFRPHDPAVFLALAAQPPARLGKLYDAMKGIAGIYRGAITLNPSFMLANWFRGAAAGYVQTGQNVSLKYNTLTGFRNALKNSPSIRAMKAATGAGGYRFGPEAPTLSGEHLRHAVGASPKSLRQTVSSILDTLEHVGEATEFADRDAIYNNILAKGGTKAEAAYQAMNLLNYGRRGSSQSLQFLTPLIPFLNARIQGLYRLFENHGDRSVLPKIMLRGALLTAATMGLWALHASDDDEWDKYQGEPLERRLNYYIFYGPGGTRFLLPKPFEMGALFSTLPEAMTEAMMTENGGRDLARIAAMTLLNTFAFNPIPAAVQPALEVATNYDFFTERPLESEGQRRLPAGQRAEPQTSGVARAIGSMTGLSPIQLETLIRGYFGTYGLTLLAGGDALAGAGGIIPAKPTGAFGSVPLVSNVLENVLGRFVKGDQDSASRWIGDLYEAKDAADQAYNGVRYARANGDLDYARRMIEEKRPQLKARGVLDKTAQKLSELTRAMNRVRADDALTGDQMAEKLKPLIRQRNDLARRAVKLAQGYAQAA